MRLAATLWRPFPSTIIMLFSPIGVARIVKLRGSGLCLLLHSNDMGNGGQRASQ